MEMLKDTWNAVTALSRLGRSQLLLVLSSAIVSTVLAGICTNWGGSAFFATIAFLVCDVVNVMYSITYENSFAFTSLAALLLEQNAVLTASTSVGIMDYAPDWAPAYLKWIAVGFGWTVVLVLVGLQLALRKDWGWHAHKMGLARTEDVALYQRILQLEGAILLDLCQVVPSCVVLLGKYGLSSQDAELVKAHDPESKLQHAVAILFFVSAIVSVVCAPVLGSSARRENAAPFGVAGFLTMCTTGCIVFGAVDALRRVGWPPQSSDAILVVLVVLTCVVRIVLIAAILRIPQTVFGSGIASRINRGSGGILLASNIEGWSECKRSAFGGRSTSAADTEGAAMLYGNIEDYSDTESDAGGNFSNPNLMYGERVRIRENSSILSRSAAAAEGAAAGHQHQSHHHQHHHHHHVNASTSSSNINNTSNNTNVSHHQQAHQHQTKRGGVGGATSSSGDPSSAKNFQQQQDQQQQQQQSPTNSMTTFVSRPGVMTNQQNTTPLLAASSVVGAFLPNAASAPTSPDGQFLNGNNGEDDDDDQGNNVHHHHHHHQTVQYQRHHQRRDGGASLLDDETSSNHSRSTSSVHNSNSHRGKNTISFVKANVVKRPSNASQK